jgi:hypothetical protein
MVPAKKSEFLDERGFARRFVQTSGAAQLSVTEGRCHRAKIIGTNAHIAIGDDQEFVLRFADQAHEAADFVVHGTAAGTVEDTNLTFRKIAAQAFDDGQRGVVVIDAENDFVVGIILAAEAGVIFVGFGIEAANGLEATDRRGESGILLAFTLRHAKKALRAIENEQIVDGGDGSQSEKEILDDGQALIPFGTMSARSGSSLCSRRGRGRARFPAVGGVSPIHLRNELRRIDAIAVADSDVDEGVQQGIGEEVWFEAEIDQLGMLGVVIMLLAFDARIGQMMNLGFETEFAAGVLD